MRVARNLAAGMANSVVLVLVNLVALPFYLHYLGMEAYGLIGFYVTLLGLAQILDLGLAPTISREIARCTDEGDRRLAASLLRTLGVVSLGLSLLIAAGGFALAPWIGSHWLEAERIPQAVVVQAVALMALTVASRWPISLYHGALVGAHRLALSSAVSISSNVSAAACTIMVLAWLSPTIQAFFVVQACFGLLHAFTLRLVAWRQLGHRGAPLDFAGLRRVWRFSAWMSGIAITSLAFTQLDKVVLSSILSLETFGHYMIAVLVVGGLQVVVAPTFHVIYPRFNSLLALEDIQGLARFYSLGTRLFATALFSLALLLAFHAQDLVMLWTGRADVALEVAPLVAVLVVGSALNGIMYFPYALQVASGRPRIAFAINAVLLVVMTPLIIVLAMRYGAMGGAISWATLGVIYVIVGAWVTGRKVMPFAGWPWLIRDVGVVLTITFVSALGGYWLARHLQLEPWPGIAVACGAAAVGICASLLAGSDSRSWLGQVLGGRSRLLPASWLASR